MARMGCFCFISEHKLSVITIHESKSDASRLLPGVFIENNSSGNKVGSGYIYISTGCPKKVSFFDLYLHDLFLYSLNSHT